MTLFLTFSFTSVVYPHSNGAPQAKTGSPGDGSNCTSCHGGTPANVTGWITTNIPTQGYTGGSSYTITVTATGTGRKGFELSPQNVAGTQLGVLSPGTGSKLVGGTKWVTHSSAGASTGTTVWNFTWTAPAAGTGTVNLYAAIVVSQPNTKLEMVAVPEFPSLPLSAGATADPTLICAGQTAQLNVTAAGGSGTYTYSWTSLPAGFSSTLQNPVVSPGVATEYIATVSDGLVSIDATVNVGVNQAATAFAGNDTTCAYPTSQVPLNGTAANYSSVLWTTSGTGTFSAANALSGLYYPSAADKTIGDVTLTLAATALSPCTNIASGLRHVHLDWATANGDQSAGQPGLTISPNPSAGYFQIRFNGSGTKTARILITDMQGKKILQLDGIKSAVRMEQIDLTGYPKGVYLVKVQTETETTVRKLVIE